MQKTFTSFAKANSYAGSRATAAVRVLPAPVNVRLLTKVKQQGLLHSYAPKIFQSTRADLKDIFASGGFSLNYDNSVYPAATINFGPQTVCIPHRDSENDPINLCHITPLGRFDHKRGGHIILHDLRLAIEFPAGASFLIPSALVVHSNTPVQPGELRQSFTQWTAGALARWVMCGSRMVSTFRHEDPVGCQRYEDGLDTRKSERLSLFSKLSDVFQHRLELEAATYPKDGSVPRPCS